MIFFFCQQFFFLQPPLAAYSYVNVLTGVLCHQSLIQLQLPLVQPEEIHV